MTSKSYYILNSDENGPEASEFMWDSTAQPGCEISMSVKVTSLICTVGKCPRLGCGALPNAAAGQRTILCPKCHLQYFPISQASNLDGYDALEASEQPVEDQVEDPALKHFRKIHVRFSTQFKIPPLSQGRKSYTGKAPRTKKSVLGEEPRASYMQYITISTCA